MREFRSFYNHKALTREQINKYCPAALSDCAHKDVSDHYNFISTKKLIEILEEKKFFVTSAMQSRARTKDKTETTKHMLKFRHESVKILKPEVGSLVPEVVLMTAHDGTSAFKFMSGLYRFVCANGLLVSDKINSSKRFRHTNCNESEIIDAVFEVLDSSTNSVSTVSDMQLKQLTANQKEEFAHDAFKLRWSNDEKAPDFHFSKLLSAKRFEDINKNDLFTVLNVLQENLIKGGTRYYAKNDSGLLVKNATRHVSSVDMNLKINEGLWNLSQNFLA